jgi:hypothetical protein
LIFQILSLKIESENIFVSYFKIIKLVCWREILHLNHTDGKGNISNDTADQVEAIGLSNPSKIYGWEQEVPKKKWKTIVFLLKQLTF